MSFQRSSESHNTIYQAAVMKVNAATGALTWATGLNNNTAAIPSLVTDGMSAHAVDATLSDRVLVAGAYGRGGVFLSALSKTDGPPLWTRVINHTGVHRVGAMALSPDGASYIGGISNNAPFVMRVSGVNGMAPSLAWMRSMAVFGSNVRGLAVQGDGVLAAVNVRGADTAFVGARLLGSDGSVVWARELSGGSADRDNTLTVAVHNGQAIFAGRFAITGFDTSGGDALLMSVNPATGAWNWGSLYYTGRGAEELMAHHVTGLVSSPTGLWVLSQGVPGSLNQHHFWGRWYQTIDDTLAFPGGTGSMRLVPYTLMSTAVTPTVTTPTTVVAHPFNPTADGTWLDQASTVTCDDPVRLEAMGFQAGTQVLLQRVEVR